MSLVPKNSKTILAKSLRSGYFLGDLWRRNVDYHSNHNILSNVLWIPPWSIVIFDLIMAPDDSHLGDVADNLDTQTTLWSSSHAFSCQGKWLTGGASSFTLNWLLMLHFLLVSDCNPLGQKSPAFPFYHYEYLTPFFTLAGWGNHSDANETWWKYIVHLHYVSAKNSDLESFIVI